MFLLKQPCVPLVVATPPSQICATAFWSGSHDGTWWPQNAHGCWTFSNRYREFFMAILQPVVCLVEKSRRTPLSSAFFSNACLIIDILKQFFVAVFNARECFQAINKIDKIGNLIFCWWNSAMSVTLLSVYLLKKLLKQLKKKICSRTMALENLERLLRELEMKTSTPRWVIKIPYCRFWVHDLEPVDSFCGQRTEKVLALLFLLESTSILDNFESLWWRFNMS